jgi:hypothetical protein
MSGKKKTNTSKYQIDATKLEPIDGWLLVCDDFPQYEAPTSSVHWAVRVGRIEAIAYRREREGQMVFFEDTNVHRVDDRHVLVRTEQVLALVDLLRTKNANSTTA